MENKQKLVGRVISGARQAAFFTQLEWVQDQCMEHMDFRPYPGTLNLELSEESILIIEELQKEKTLSLIPPDPQFCAAKAMTVMINDISGAIIIPSEDVNIHEKNIIEIMAPIGLRKALDLNDGDSVTVIINKPG